MKLWRNLLWFGALTGISTVFMLSLPAAVGETKNENRATIMATGSGLGETSPCG